MSAAGEVRAPVSPPLALERLPAVDTLALAAVAGLPFTYALTLDVGFPLKLYELAMALAALAAFADLRVRGAPGSRRLVAPLALSLLAAAAVLAYRLRRPLDTLDLFATPLRFGAAGDGATKLVYFGFAIFAFLAFSHAAVRHERLYTRLWVAAAIVSAAYTWVLFVSSLIEVPPPLLPGIEKPQVIALGDNEFIRSGTFEEGNFLGLYLVCSTAVAWYARRPAAALFLSATVFITFSTANVIGLALFWLGTGWSFAFSRQGGVRRGVAIAAIAGSATLIAALLVMTGYAMEFVVEKLTTDEFSSKFDRLDTAIAGLRMFVDHPLVGVGIGQYNYHYQSYYVVDVFARLRDYQSIANNVYVELLAETGLLGFGCALLFQRRLLRAARGAQLAPLRWGAAAILLVFNAFPSYVLLFLWAFWALLYAAAVNEAARSAGVPA